MIREFKNAISIEKAYEARDLFLNVDYDLIQQTRRNKFSYEKDSRFDGMPSEDEIFTAKFYRSGFLEKSKAIHAIYHSLIKPLIESTLKKEFSQHDIRCYKMEKGSHFRIHKDDYQSTYGFVWYLNVDWKWDWGGLLLVLKEGLNAEVFIPEFNKLVIMDHQSGQMPHAVTEITEYAKEPRLTMVGFLQ
jgi:Rps23 Pro-64 3,4-dihydroxylase Tpa1-like proline 4-hydroxylase